MFCTPSSLLFLSASAAWAQQIGTMWHDPQNPPAFNWLNCTAPGNCSRVYGGIVIDANSRQATRTDLDGRPCYDETYFGACPEYVWEPDPAEVCALEDLHYSSNGVDVEWDYSMTPSRPAKVRLQFVDENELGTTKGRRVFLLNGTFRGAGHGYEMFYLLGKEFSFDVDVSQVPCGLNAALYFVGMDADGGMSRSPNNLAGARYGTGYCDSRCPRNLKFINGAGNCEWDPWSGDGGEGPYGSCCPEMDVWESNSESATFAAHPCTNPGQHVCDGAEGCGYYEPAGGWWGSGPCDSVGCDFNSFRLGNRTFYGPDGYDLDPTINTLRPFKVVTQFHTSGGQLSEIRRFYVQDGRVIPNSVSTTPGITGDSITQQFCDQQYEVYGNQFYFEPPSFHENGGMASMTAAMARGMVLAMKLDDRPRTVYFDGLTPTDLWDPEVVPGIIRGRCPLDGPDPALWYPDAHATFSKFRFGPIGSTYPPL